MMKTIFWIIFVLMVAIGLSSLPSQAENREAPSIVSRCIPQQTRQVITSTELIGSTHYQEKEYYLLAAYSQNESADLIISVTVDSITEHRCTEEFFNPMGDPIPLASVVPETVAQQLTLARYQQRINQIGKAALQQQINQSADSVEHPSWFAEEVWALQQLGITIPDNVQVQP
jgi:hypothetical protein